MARARAAASARRGVRAVSPVRHSRSPIEQDRKSGESMDEADVSWGERGAVVRLRVCSGARAVASLRPSSSECHERIRSRVHAHVHGHIRVSTRMCTRMCTRVSMRMCTCVYAHVRARVCMCMCVDVARRSSVRTCLVITWTSIRLHQHAIS